MGPSRTYHRLQGPREAVLKAYIAPEGRGEKIGVFHKDYRGVGMEGGVGGPFWTLGRTGGRGAKISVDDPLWFRSFPRFWHGFIRI